jgi:hypothetical protein
VPVYDLGVGVRVEHDRSPAADKLVAGVRANGRLVVKRPSTGRQLRGGKIPASAMQKFKVR